MICPAVSESGGLFEMQRHCAAQFSGNIITLLKRSLIVKKTDAPYTNVKYSKYFKYLYVD